MTAETLTLTAAATAARALGYTIRRTVDSEVVAYRKGEGVNSPAAYFTNDPADALATVQEMARRDKLAADAAALDPADAQREATAAADKAGRLAESDPLAAAFAYDRAAAMTRRTVALYAGHGKRGQVQDKAAAYDKRAFDLRAAYCKAAAREAAELESALSALPEGAAAYARECIADGAAPAEAIEAGKAAERRARAEARAAARRAGHECEDRADAMTGEARARELDRAADYFDKAGANPTPGGQSLGHYAARARACREEVAAIRQGIETRKRAPQRPEEGRRVIDMTPTWAGLAPALFMALTNGTPEGQRIAREELTRALAALDAHNAAAKAAQRPEMTDAQRAQISARLDRASVGNLRAYAFATLAHGQDVPEAAEDNLPGFAQPVTA